MRLYAGHVSNTAPRGSMARATHDHGVDDVIRSRHHVARRHMMYRVRDRGILRVVYDMRVFSFSG